MTELKVYPKICQRCSAYFRGNRLQRVCDPCRVDAPTGDTSELVSLNCQLCEVEFMGHRLSKRCVPCDARYRRERNSELKKIAYDARRAIVAGPKKPSIPPPCARCAYCQPTDAYPSGMACLAEAFMRCQPWAPGAQPLKEV
jgi:hypothetical protein